MQQNGTNQENDILNLVIKTVVANPDSKKSQFIKLIIEKNTFDKMIYYLMDIYEITKKKNRSKDEINKLEEYKKITKEIVKGE